MDIVPIEDDVHILPIDVDPFPVETPVDPRPTESCGTRFTDVRGGNFGSLL